MIVMKNSLESKSISFSYDSSMQFNFPDINLSESDSLLILGDSGVGKTTFIQILAGLLIPKHGSIKLDNTIYGNLSKKEMDKFRGKNIGMIFQRPHFVRNISVLNNLLLSLYLSKSIQYRKSAIQLLQEVGLGNKLESLPNELSEGEQQRASIALALVKNPSLILADEPTSSLDDTNCHKIITLLKEQAVIRKSKLIIITHDNRLKSQFDKSIIL